MEHYLPKKGITKTTLFNKQTKPIILFHKVTKEYSLKAPLFSNVTFLVNPGDFLFITGVSGSGKTTILNLILSIEHPQKGQVFFNGVNIHGIPKNKIPFHKQKIGVIFQDYRLLSQKTVRSNVALPLQIKGLRKKLIQYKIDCTYIAQCTCVYLM